MLHMVEETGDNLIIEETVKTFQPYYQQPLSRSDALEIHQNLTGFFELLLRLDKNNRDKENVQGCEINKNKRQGD